jgi:hypothetical protein
MAPIPLLIASPGVDGNVVARLRDALLVCHAEPSLAATRETLLLARFGEIIPPATTFFSLGSDQPTRGESPRRPDDNRFGICSTVAHLQQTLLVEGNSIGLTA